MEFVNLLDILEQRVASLVEEVAALRKVSGEADQLRAENNALREQLANERQARGVAADRISALVDRLDRHLANVEEPKSDQG